MEQQVPEDLVEKYNRLAEESDVDWSMHLAGKITREVKIPNEECPEIRIWALNYINHIINIGRMEKNMNDLHLTDIWVNSQYAGEFNPKHFHSGDVSGVLFLKIPEDYAAEIEAERAINQPTRGFLQLVHGEKQDFKQSNVTFEPKVGRLIMFPAYMWHQVYPFYCDGERRSLSFNTEIV